MEEKILLKSEPYNRKKILQIFGILGVLGGIIYYFYHFNMWACGEPLMEYIWETIKEDGFFGVGDPINFGFLVSLAIWIIGLIVYFWVSKIEMTISNKRVFGKAAFGRRVDLPLDSISAVGARWPKGIAVSTSSGKIAFLMIKNCDEIHRVISELLVERQTKQPVVSSITQEVSQSNADELKKFKELFDAGIITQEEFDAKKNQLLGL